MRYRFLGVLALALLAAGSASAQTLRIGLQDDPDALDPMLSGTFVGRVVFAGLCDKLIDVDPKLNYVPQLATRWEWSDGGRTLTLHLRDGVLFQDGTKLDAEAVRFNLERYQKSPGSKRTTELRSLQSVEMVDPLTVRLHLAHPDAPLLSVLADRAGMMISPKAAQAAGQNFSLAPVCAGPFRFAKRVAQDHIELDRFGGYWDAKNIHFDRVVYQIVPASNVRLVDLRAGSLDLIERVAATDISQVRADKNLKLESSVALGYYTMSINVANGPKSKGPLGNPKVREALEAAIDRNALNQVVFDGQYVPTNQAQAPGTTFYNADRPVPPRDIAKAKRLLVDAGQPHPSFTLLVVNTPIDQQVGEVIQSMATEAGFDIHVQPLEQNTLVTQAEHGDYEAAIVIWSGRADPDGNVSIWLQCDGFLNWGKYCSRSLDNALAEGRQHTDVAERQASYKKASDIYLNDRPHLFLYNYRLFWAMKDNLKGFTPYPDGIIRLQGMTLDTR